MKDSRIFETDLLNGEWKPRDNGVIVSATPIETSGLIIATGAEATADTTIYKVVAKANSINDIYVGDYVQIAAAALIELFVLEKASKDVKYYWCKENFIKATRGG